VGPEAASDSEATSAFPFDEPPDRSPPAGIYTIPEIATVGASEQDARDRHGDAVVGRARFAEIARGQISGSYDGLLKLVVAPDTRRVLGCQVVGDGATELVHLAQLAMINGNDVELFVDHIFNFPTLAEAYRVAALDALGQLNARERAPVSG
jgi:NAD(P) transhydrogenase